MGSFDRQEGFSIRNGTLPVVTKPQNVSLVELQPMVLVDVLWLFTTYIKRILANSTNRERTAVSELIFGDSKITGFHLFNFPSYGPHSQLSEERIMALMKTTLFKFMESFMLQYIYGLYDETISTSLTNLNRTGNLNIPMFMVQLVELCATKFGSSPSTDLYAKVAYWYSQPTYKLLDNGNLSDTYTLTHHYIHDGSFKFSLGKRYNRTFEDFFSEWSSYLSSLINSITNNRIGSIMQFVQSLAIQNDSPKMDFYLRIVSTYECYGLIERNLYNYCNNNVIYFFRSVVAYQIPHQSLLISQPKLYLNVTKSSKEIHLALVKHICLELFKPSDASKFGDLMSLINYSTTSTLDKSVSSIKESINTVKILTSITEQIDNKHKEYKVLPDNHLDLVRESIISSMKAGLNNVQLRNFESALEQLEAVIIRFYLDFNIKLEKSSNLDQLTEELFEILVLNQVIDTTKLYSITKSFIKFDLIQMIFGISAFLIRFFVTSPFPLSSKFETYSITFKPYPLSNEWNKPVTIGTFTVRPLADRHMIIIESSMFGSDYKVPIDFGSDMLPQLYQWTVDQFTVRDRFNNLSYVEDLLNRTSRQTNISQLNLETRTGDQPLED